jgi:Xaa-Pro dipeptidase
MVGVTQTGSPIFTAAEIERRWREVRSRLGEAECAVVPSFWNSYYLSGFPVPQWGRWAITVLFRDRDPAIVIPAFEAAAADAKSPVRDVHLYRDDDGESSMETATTHVIDVLRNADAAVIGVEGRGMPATMFLQLQRAFPDAGFLDVTDAIEEVRVVSSDEEIAYLRTASQVADIGIQVVLDRMGPGIPESHLSAEAQLAMARAVPEGVEASVKCYMQQGQRSDLCHSASTSAPIEAGGIVEVVSECELANYRVAVERCVLVGQTPAHVDRAYNAMVEAFDAAREAVAPGIRFADVDLVARKILVEAGFDQVTVGAGLVRNITDSTGGRIEFASFRPGNDRPLEPGMVATVEPWAVVPGVGSPRHCDVVLVTDTGHELLSRAPDGVLRVAGRTAALR